MLHLKKRIANLLLRFLWNAVSEDQLIAFREKRGRRVVIFAGKEISPELAKELAIEARFWRATQLYSLIRTHMKASLNKSMYISSKTDSDLFFGKAGLWNLDVQDQLLDKISQIDQ